MNTAEIKNNLHEFIVETNDRNVLTQIHEYFTSLKIKKADWWDEISEQDKASIEVGLSQLKNGEGIPHEKVRAKIDVLLGENG